MTKNEIETLENKTKAIVDTLYNLEEEIKEYQSKNIDIVLAIKNLTNISEQIALASIELKTAASLFSDSDFSNAMKEIDKKIKKINDAEIILTDQSKAIEKIVDDVLTEYKNLSIDIKSVNKSIREIIEIQNTVDETKNLLDTLALKIDRIDRNTQKGFRKERG